MITTHSKIGRKSKTTALAIVAELKKYYHFIAPSVDPTTQYYDYLLNLQYLKSYLDYLQEDCDFSPTTVSEKIRRLRMAMEFVLYKENPMETDTKLFTRSHQIMMHIAKWGKSLSKGIKEQRRNHSFVSAKQVSVNIYAIYDLFKATIIYFVGGECHRS